MDDYDSEARFDHLLRLLTHDPLGGDPPMSAKPTDTFYFDEFFGSDAEGVEVTLTIRGRAVPVRIRRGLTLREKVEAQAKAVKRHVTPDGRPVIDSIDEAAIAEELAFKLLLSWPFVTRDGSPVPITRENVAALLGGLDDLIEISRKMETEGEAALRPFASKSAEA